MRQESSRASAPFSKPPVSVLVSMDDAPAPNRTASPYMHVHVHVHVHVLCALIFSVGFLEIEEIHTPPISLSDLEIGYILTRS